jgi:hypothetical protein
MQPTSEDHAENGEFRLGRLFHLTPLVDSIGDAALFFNSVFAPVCMMRGYSEHWHRHGAIYVIAETSIEPMEPPLAASRAEGYELVPLHGQVRAARPQHRCLRAERPPSPPALEQAGVRTTDGGAPGTVFAHPKDTPECSSSASPSVSSGPH